MKFTIQLTCQMLKNQQTIDTICFVQSPEVETKFSKLISAKAVFFFFPKQVWILFVVEYTDYQLFLRALHKHYFFCCVKCRISHLANAPELKSFT